MCKLLSMVIWKPKLRYLDLQLPQAAPLCDHHPDQLQEIIGSDGILYLRLADGNSAQVRISFVGWSLQFFQMGRYLKTRISYNFKRDNIWILRGSNLYSMVPILKIPNEHINYGCFGGSNCETAPLYSPLGNSMRSHVLLRLVGGKELWKSMRAASSLFGKHGFDYWYFYLRFCMFGIYLMCQVHWELDCVGFCPFEIWRCDCVEMMRGIGGEGFFFSILGYRQSIAGNTWVVLPGLVLSLLLLLLLLLLVLLVLLLLLLHTFPLPDRVACATRGTRSSRHWATALRAWGQRPTLALSGIVWTASVLAPVSLVGRFTLTVVVVKLASHCVFQQNHSK